jgi:hypothetical protein
MATPAEILSEAHTIALVGASPKPWRASHTVMRYLLEHRYRVLPVRPHVPEVLGVPRVGSLSELDEPSSALPSPKRPRRSARRRSGSSSGSSRPSRARSRRKPGWLMWRTRAPPSSIGRSGAPRKERRQRRGRGFNWVSRGVLLIQFAERAEAGPKRLSLARGDAQREHLRRPGIEKACRSWPASLDENASRGPPGAT